MITSFNTEVGLLAVWDSQSLSFINSEKEYLANFVEDKDILNLINSGKAIIWGTGGDGAFKTTVKINPDSDLSESEKKFVDLKVLNLHLAVTSSKVYIGSPEFVGYIESEAFKNQHIEAVDLEIGNYLVSIYFLNDIEVYGYIVVFKKVSDDYSFPAITDLPQLG